MNARFRVATPPNSGAIAIIDLFGDVDACLRALDARPVKIGDVALCNLAGIDRGVVARWSETHAQIMPHAGREVMRALVETLTNAGAREDRRPDPREGRPEARDVYEACMLQALADAASPAAIPVLLQQPARWRRDVSEFSSDESSQRTIELNRLLTPPTVVAVGRPNVGKSSLTNALARAAVSITSDIPGTTRDHVGVALELPSPWGGVAIRWIDAPGFREDESPDVIEREAIAAARAVVASADLLIHCGDAEHGFVGLARTGASSRQSLIRVGTRCDLATVDPCDLQTSAAAGTGIAELADRIRRALVPDEAFTWPGPWLFHEALTGEASDRG